MTKIPILILSNFTFLIDEDSNMTEIADAKFGYFYIFELDTPALEGKWYRVGAIGDKNCIYSRQARVVRVVTVMLFGSIQEAANAKDNVKKLAIMNNEHKLPVANCDMICTINVDRYISRARLCVGYIPEYVASMSFITNAEGQQTGVKIIPRRVLPGWENVTTTLHHLLVATVFGVKSRLSVDNIKITVDYHKFLWKLVGNLSYAQRWLLLKDHDIISDDDKTIRAFSFGLIQLDDACVIYKK
jgi:hypothetical protein